MADQSIDLVAVEDGILKKAVLVLTEAVITQLLNLTKIVVNSSDGSDAAIWSDAGTVGPAVAGHVFEADLQTNQSDFNETIVIANGGPEGGMMRLGFTDLAAAGASEGQIQCYRDGSDGGVMEFRTRQYGDGPMVTVVQINSQSVNLKGGLYFQAGVNNLSVHANNAAALTAGLLVGQAYRTGGDPDHVCVVH